MSAGVDELYTEFFECPKCHEEMITRNSKFCPDCGYDIRHYSR